MKFSLGYSVYVKCTVLECNFLPTNTKNVIVIESVALVCCKKWNVFFEDVNKLLLSHIS